MNFIPSSNFTNPFLNEIFLPAITGTTGVFLIGLIVLLALFNGDHKKFFNDKVGQIYLGWLTIIPFFIVASFCSRIPGLVIVTATALLAVHEIARLSSMPTISRNILYAFAFITIVCATFFPTSFLSLPLLYFLGANTIAIKLNNKKESFHQAMMSLFVMIWILFGLGHLILISYLGNVVEDSKAIIFTLILAASLSDIGAAVFGRLLNKRKALSRFKIAKNITPNKNYFGILGNMAGAGLGIAVMWFALKGIFTPLEGIIAAWIIGSSGSFGGLTNSMFKRAYNIQDSNWLLSRHGGVLDRIDSLVRISIATYYMMLTHLL